jgi:5-methylcytosine-specific restriction endonuclease McrA
MNPIRPKQPRLRLDAEAYQQLCRQVLQRDGWRCQGCGAMQQLQIHHKEFRSHSGHDAEDNLITLCDPCHKRVHTNRNASTARYVERPL